MYWERCPSRVPCFTVEYTKSNMSRNQSGEPAEIPERPSFESWWKKSKEALSARNVTFVENATQ